MWVLPFCECFLALESSFGFSRRKNRENPFGILPVYGFLRCGA